ncbi:MAG TPA: hypothetical protein VHX38_13860 [Pseudonocardiaceae bacterium]|nr:hypothetical protein [Pseudonocardiaceae bacterium]
MEVLKKAGVVAAAAAGLIMLGAPAFASTAHLQGEGWGGGHGGGQVGLVNVSNVDILHNVNAVAGACGDNVGVLGAAVPILSPSIVGHCAGGGIANG